MLGPRFLNAGTLLLFCGALQMVEGAKILALLNVASPSHHIFNRVLTRALATRGHQVTVITPDLDKDVVPNLTVIHLEGVYDALKADYNYEDFSNETAAQMIFSAFDWVSYVCEVEFQSAGFKKLLNYPSTERFDLIITEAGFSECFYGFIPKFGSPPVVAISAYGITPWTSTFMGTPENPSYMPNTFLPYTSEMSFAQRINNFFTHYLWIILYEYSHIPNMEAMGRKYITEDMPSYWDIERNFSIYLANAAFGLDDPRPVSPNIIPIGGMHIKAKPDPLPKDLKTFLDEAKEGFIFFSLGSNLQCNSLKMYKLQALMNAFAELPQRVLWKFESDNLPGQPSNVKIGKWLPQSDILAHPNIKMFISHCGKMSTTEATYRGVPVVGMPFFADQILNIKKLQSKGLGVELSYHTLSKESVLHAVREVLHNDSYRNNMKKASQIFRDQGEIALERAVYWTEYVIRHNGATHLRSAAVDLYWYQYLLLDVLLFLAAVVLVALFTVFLVLRTVFRMLFKKSTKKIKTK